MTGQILTAANADSLPGLPDIIQKQLDGTRMSSGPSSRPVCRQPGRWLCGSRCSGR
ncbi:hypothetical protein NKG94_28400 [Micromonospora sp. M12]